MTKPLYHDLVVAHEIVDKIGVECHNNPAHPRDAGPGSREGMLPQKRKQDAQTVLNLGGTGLRSFGKVAERGIDLLERAS